MSQEQKDRHDDEYKSLEALFIVLLRCLHTDEEESALAALAELRTDIAFQYVCRGMGVEVDEAMMLIKNQADSNLTQYDKDLRDRLIAAINNLIDFSVCQEYQLYDEVLDSLNDADIDFDSEEYQGLLGLCEKYNDKYSSIENSDIEYAGKIAALWITISSGDYLTYWTQNDANVRPWHMALQGYTAHKNDFPSWMIPPIEYNCRCFLECTPVSYAQIEAPHIKGSIKALEKPSQISNVYSESLAKCGRIFNSSHSYFTVKEKDKEMLMRIVDNIKEKYYGQ